MFLFLAVPLPGFYGVQQWLYARTALGFVCNREALIIRIGLGGR